MSLLTLEMKEVREELQKLQELREIQDLHIECNLNKIYITNGILNAIAHLVTKFEGIECECKKINNKKNNPKITYLILMKECNYKNIQKTFFSKIHMKEYFENNSIIFAESDENKLFDISSFSRIPYLKHFFEILNQLRKEKGIFFVDQDMINESVDEVLGLDEDKVNKKRYR